MNFSIKTKNKIIFLTKKSNSLIFNKINKKQILITLNGFLGSLNFVRDFGSIAINNISAYLDSYLNSVFVIKSIKQSEKIFITNRAELISFYGEIIQKYDWLTAGFFHEFIIRGIGYRYKFHRSNKTDSLLFKIGYAHKILFKLDKNRINFRNNKRYDFVLSAMNKSYLKKIAEQIRCIKPTDSYKGKGIKYYNTPLKLKVGKVR